MAFDCLVLFRKSHPKIAPKMKIFNERFIYLFFGQLLLTNEISVKAEKWQIDIMLRLIMILLMTHVLEDGRC